MAGAPVDRGDRHLAVHDRFFSGRRITRHVHRRQWRHLAHLHGRLGARGKLHVRRALVRQVTHDARGDRQHQLTLAHVVLVAAEQPAKARDVAKAGNLVATGVVVVAHQAGQHLGFAVVQAQAGLRVAGVDLDRDGALAGGLQRGGVADLQRHLDRHFVVQVHGGLHF